MLKKFKHLSEVWPKHYRVIDASNHRMPHLIYPRETVENLKMQHIKPQKLADWTALWGVKTMTIITDIISGYAFKPLTEKKWLTRSLMMQTIASLPGMLASIHRHLRSVRRMQKDTGWIHHLLQESDNERFHFITFVKLRNPGIFLRFQIMSAQFIYGSIIFLVYGVSPRHCHKFVGYLEQHAFTHYTDMLKQIDKKDSVLSHWKKVPASQEARQYYQLDEGATLKDVIMQIRVDEVLHQESNHFFGQVNPNFDLEEEKIRIYHDKGFGKTKQGQ